MELKPHQHRVLSKGDRPFALHGTGTGKTLTSLKFIEASDSSKPVILITSSALKDNLSKEVDKHNLDIDLSKLHTVTHEGMSRPNISNKVHDLLKDGGTMVIDEIHKLRNPASKGYTNTMSASGLSDRVIGLTGTAIVNNVDDLSSLYGLVKGEKVRPTSEFIKETEVYDSTLDKILKRNPRTEHSIKDIEGLKENFKDLDIYYPPGNHPDMPRVIEKTEYVEMPSRQVVGYKLAEKEAIKGRSDLAELARKIRKGIELSKTEKAKANAFASQTSQAAISSARHVPGEVSSGKLDKAVDDLKEKLKNNPKHRGVIYSNKIEAGLNPLLDRLSTEGLNKKVQVVSGSTNKSEVKDIVSDYNSGKKPILVISDSGAEGLDLKGTRSIQILNPHFNDGKIKQAVGRGARLGSHSHLRERDREVEVTHYHSVMPKTLGLFKSNDQTIDQGMASIMKHKADLRDLVLNSIQKRRR